VNGTEIQGWPLVLARTKLPTDLSKVLQEQTIRGFVAIKMFGRRWPSEEFARHK
jgi:hypothetical protein